LYQRNNRHSYKFSAVMDVIPRTSQSGDETFNQNRYFSFGALYKEELLHSTLVSLAHELIRRNAVSFQSLPTCTAHCWQVAPRVCWQKMTKKEKNGETGIS